MGRIELRDFDGDFEALHALARATWLEEYGAASWPDLYRPELTRLFCAGLPDPRFLVAAYDGASLVGFVANLPRVYRLKGRLYKAILSCMLVTRPGYRGAATYLISECLQRNQAYGADFALMTLERPHRSWRMFGTYVRSAYRFETVRTMVPLLHAVDFEQIVVSEALQPLESAALRLVGADRRIMAPATPGAIRPYRGDDLPQARALMVQAGTPSVVGRKANILARVFDDASLARQFSTEGVTATVVYERGGAVQGFANFSIRDMVSPRGSAAWAWLEFLSWEGCGAAERRALLAGLWEASRARGCIGILEWNKGYDTTRSLLAARVRALPAPPGCDRLDSESRRLAAGDPGHL